MTHILFFWGNIFFFVRKCHCCNMIFCLKDIHNAPFLFMGILNVIFPCGCKMIFLHLTGAAPMIHKGVSGSAICVM